MKKPVMVILLDEADIEYKKLNEMSWKANKRREGQYTRDEVTSINRAKEKID